MKIFGLLAIVIATTLWAGARVAKAAPLWRRWNGSLSRLQRQGASGSTRRTRGPERAAKPRAATQGHTQEQPAADATRGQQDQRGGDTGALETIRSSSSNRTPNDRDNHRVHVALAAAGVVAALVLAPKFTVAVLGAGVLAAVAYALVPPMLAAMKYQGEGSRFDAFTRELKAHLESTANEIKERAARARNLRQGASTAWSNTLSWLGKALDSLAGSAGRTASATN